MTIPLISSTASRLFLYDSRAKNGLLIFKLFFIIILIVTLYFVQSIYFLLVILMQAYLQKYPWVCPLTQQKLKYFLFRIIQPEVLTLGIPKTTLLFGNTNVLALAQTFNYHLFFELSWVSQFRHTTREKNSSEFTTSVPKGGRQSIYECRGHDFSTQAA